MNQHLHKYKKLSNDELLIAYIEEGDEYAYSELYIRHVPKVSAALKKLLRNTSVPNKEDARKEIIQKTLLNLLNSKSFKEGKIENFQVYLYRTMENTFFTHCKGIKKQDNKDKEYQRTYSNHIREDDYTKEEMEEDYKALDEAIEKLSSEKQKEAIILRMSGHSYRMIAQKMGTEEGRIKNYINRGKKAIRKILGIQP